MTTFYKGVGFGTFLYSSDLRITGIACHDPGASASSANLKAHIARGTTVSPFVSLSRSYGVAKDYAIDFSAALPTATMPAYVYEIDIDPSHGLRILDPVHEVARGLKNPLASISYHHDGGHHFSWGSSILSAWRHTCQLTLRSLASLPVEPRDRRI